MNDAGPDGERVRGSVKVADRTAGGRPPQARRAGDAGERSSRRSTNSAKVADARRRRAGAAQAGRVRRARRPCPRPRWDGARLDVSSPVFQVDHSACILCDRCVRACDDVQKNDVIGRTGKGVTAGDQLRSQRPDGGIGLRAVRRVHGVLPDERDHLQAGRARSKFQRQDRSKNFLSPAELISDPLFAGVSPKFLLWQQGLVVRRTLKQGRRALPAGRGGQHGLSDQEAASWKSPCRAGQTPQPKILLGRLLPHARPKVVARFERTPEAGDHRRDGVHDRHAAHGHGHRADPRRGLGNPPQRARPAHARAEPASSFSRAPTATAC